MKGRARNWVSTVLMGAAIVFGCSVLYALPDKDNDNRDREDNDSRIQEGFRLVSELDLNLNGKNRALVGLGAYLVNAVGGCNDCHTNPPYPDGGDPTRGQPKHLNKKVYLGGGTPFIPAQNGNPAIVSRNLTPDKTGKPEGGASFEEFRDIIRTGVDPDHAHPGYGPFLIVMPWPVYQGMTDHDLRAIYEFLGTIKCVEGDPGLPNPREIGTRCK